MYESAGLYGQSTLRKLNPSTGQVIQKVPIPSNYFAEGIAVVGTNIYMLTWKEGIMLIFDTKTLRHIGTRKYYGEGWGLAYDGQYLIASDGTSKLSFYKLPDLSDSTVTYLEKVKKTYFFSSSI